MKQYGISEIKSIQNEEERHVENILLKGFTILQNIITQEKAELLNKKLETIYALQQKEFTNLQEINEEDVVRIPLYYDEEFLHLLNNPQVINILKQLLGHYFILHLQNGIINRPSKEHHQTSWHRDIPYQEYITSKPISINVFYCLSPFNEKTGATKILPYSHLKEKFPSIEFAEENALTVNANAGDVVIFDSWLYHRASSNSSNIIRYGLNHVYTIPILKQQIDLPKFLNGKYKDIEPYHTILGYKFATPSSVLEYRNNRLNKK